MMERDQDSFSRLNGIYKISGAAALIAGILLLIAMISLVFTTLQPTTINSGLSSIENNWLVVIFKLLAGFSGVQIDQLQVLKLLDVVILALAGMMHIGLYLHLKRISKMWSLLALAQPFLGIAIFIATKTAGRSALMGAVMVSSILMLRSHIFNKGIALIGILAGVLLYAGDLSVGISPNTLIATLFGIGYVTLIIWFFLIARRFYSLTGVD